jgi:16S rRNA (cytidine1402-2'-O)-methyltransferase
MDRFIYEGFLPRKKRRQSRLADLAEQNRTVVLYESPQRIQKTLVEILAVFGNRQVAVARELTKLHEEVIRGNLEDVISRMQDKTWRGEITLVISSQAYKLVGDRKPEAG